jgi:hypothetical protein
MSADLVSAASKISSDIKKRAGKDRKNKKKGYVSDYSSSSTGSRTTTSSSSVSDGLSYPATKAYIDKKQKETGKSRTDIRNSLTCNKCNKIGHIAPDCRGEKLERGNKKKTDSKSVFASHGTPFEELFDFSCSSTYAPYFDELEEKCNYRHFQSRVSRRQ